jgi:hypothetical protein
MEVGPTLATSLEQLRPWPLTGSALARIRSAPSTGALFIAPCLRSRYVGFKRKTASLGAEGDIRKMMMRKTGEWRTA